MQLANSTDVVSSAELTRNFAYWQERATRAPVTITYHGHPRYILMSAEAWRGAAAEADPPDGDSARRDLEYQFLLEHIDEGFLVLDAGLHIRAASSLGALFCNRPARALLGGIASQAIPALAHGAAAAGLRHALVKGEQTQFEVPLDGEPGARLSVRAFPWVEGVALLLRVHHEDVEERLRAVREAFEKAAAAHGALHVVRLTVRGTIESATPGFAARLGLDDARLTGLRFTDLLAIADRVAARERIERILGARDEAEGFDAHLLIKGAREVPVRVAVSAVAEGYAVGGALAVVTFAAGPAQ